MMKGYKAFNPGMKCLGKEYKENSVFEEKYAKVCRCGFHFCKNPFDVLSSYPLVNENGDFSEFAEVESLDDDLTDDGERFCTKKIKIGAKLKFADFIKACVNSIKEGTAFETQSGRFAKIGSSGDVAHIGSSGDGAKIGSSGRFAKIGSSGSGAKIGSSGYGAKIGSSGSVAHIGSSGDGAKIGSSGYGAQIGSSGSVAHIGSSGSVAHIGSSGYGAKIGSSGYGAKINASGKNSVIAAIGIDSAIRAKVGAWITLAEYDDSGICVCVKSAKVDGVTIKEGVYYCLKNGDFEALL